MPLQQYHATPMDRSTGVGDGHAHDCHCSLHVPAVLPLYRSPPSARISSTPHPLIIFATLASLDPAHPKSPMVATLKLSTDSDRDNMATTSNKRANLCPSQRNAPTLLEWTILGDRTLLYVLWRPFMEQPAFCQWPVSVGQAAEHRNRALAIRWWLGASTAEYRTSRGRLKSYGNCTPSAPGSAWQAAASMTGTTLRKMGFTACARKRGQPKDYRAASELIREVTLCHFRTVDQSDLARESSHQVSHQDSELAGSDTILPSYRPLVNSALL